jgi:hypothetical protein
MSRAIFARGCEIRNFEGLASVGVGGQAVVAVGGDAVVFLAGLLYRVDVHDRPVEVGEVVQQSVVHLARYGVSFGYRQTRVHRHVLLGVKRLLAPRRVRAKAIPSGIVVAASPELWMVSYSSNFA